jgi:hypothetical protein
MAQKMFDSYFPREWSTLKKILFSKALLDSKKNQQAAEPERTTDEQTCTDYENRDHQLSQRR